MGWKGFAVGSILGGARGGWVGALVCAFIGDWLERRFAPELKARFARSQSSRPAGRPSSGPLDDAYHELGVASSAPDEVVTAAYRALAKKFHPDAVRARGLSDADVARANARMGRINAAWAKIKEERRM